MSSNIKITPGFLISLMSLARKHDSEQLISMLNLEKSSILTQESLERFAELEPKTAEELTDPGSMLAKERQQARADEPKPEPAEEQIPLSFFNNGEEVIGFVKRFVDERDDLHQEPKDILNILSNFYSSVEKGTKHSYEELAHALMRKSVRKEDVMLPDRDVGQEFQGLVQERGYTGEQTGPALTEEELQTLPSRDE